MRYLIYILILICCLIPLQVYAQNKENQSPLPESRKLTLAKTAMCEGIKDHRPHDEAIVFSIRLRSIYCFSDFDPVPEKGVIIHRWFRKETLRLEKKLSVKPPRWSTYSKIQPRKADKGPWRVEITDQHGTIFKTLRFSITD